MSGVGSGPDRTLSGGTIVVKSRTARSTGLLVELIDAEASPDFDPAEGGRWVTLCVEHSEFVQHETRRLATSFLATPEEWCEACRPVAEERAAPNLARLRAWLNEKDDRGVERGRTRSVHARLYGRVGGLGWTGRTINVSFVRGSRREYHPVFERTLAGDLLELRGPSGRYVNWREVVR